MKRRNRFFLHALLPPLFGGTLIFGLVFVSGPVPPDWGTALAFFALAILWAYVWALVPSLAYAGLMEWAFGRGMVPGSRRAVALSALLGTVVGSIPLVSELFDAHRRLRLTYAMPSVVGFAVGVLVEILVAALARRRALTAPTSNP
jgi:hypothetical protein